jgi:hypothetical protein
MLSIQQAMLLAARAAQKPAALRLLSIAATVIFVAATWHWRAIWLGGPAPSYVALANITRDGECSARLFDNDWYGAHVLALTNGAVFDVFTPSLPTLPVLIAPLALVPSAWLPALWFVANAGALGLSALIMSSLASCDRERVLIVLGLIVIMFSAPLHEDLVRGQLYVAVLLLHTIVLWAIVRNRLAAGGVALGVLFALKATGLPFWLLLAGLRRFRVLAWGMAALAILFLVSTGACGLEIWRVYVTTVLPAALSSALATHTAFQTVPAFFQHLFRYDATLNPLPLDNLPWLATACALMVIIALLGATLLRMRRVGLRRVMSAASILSVTLMPQAEQYHYLALFAPFGLSAMSFAALTNRTRVALVVAVLCVYAPLPYKDSALAAGPLSLLAYPRLYGALLLWAIILFRKPNAE